MTAGVDSSRRSLARQVYFVNIYCISTSILRLDTKIRTNLQAHEKKGGELPVGVDEEMGTCEGSVVGRLARFLNDA